MIDFWIGAGLLLMAALLFLLLPIMRGRRAQTEEDRTSLNVALYQERLDELQAQHASGTLTSEQLEAGRAEAARELLNDTEGGEAHRVSRLGRGAPLVAALLVPLMGYGLYLHWGASDKVELARQFAQQAGSIGEVTQRLERAVEAQPESAEGWYFLGRAYMAQERAADAAVAFERATNLAGRQPELLGQWAQALYFAGDKQWTEQLQALTDEALKADPAEVTSLGLLGIAAYEEGRFAQAIAFWERLVAVLGDQDPSRAAIEGGIARARAELGESAVESQAAVSGGSAPSVEVKVSVQLSPELADEVQPDDSVFVFARAVSGPPMPLAVKRLSVADLPAEVTLADADAMMPQLKLSNFEQVQLVARISRDGDATRGEWTGQSDALDLAASAERPVQLTIDKPERR
ncbi:c-type cytochrome biogenesis protein CcmI [Stutzerimonas azotifigens]|uniref:C-type cytochrome biogenesis protein CcmI n=1 Tax=Stutzerimonas azotifigens TaxID=291995 RepID=A0ABR5YY09_9GAMM|nr:c-type cytochrome biogenesis protein CcmI [Stutzerimonas azotifigens]MBA1272835.1 c-type cytochrome biogenesis protein CcmI [Stutzerimonas azotifigens]